MGLVEFMWFRCVYYLVFFFFFSLFHSFFSLVFLFLRGAWWGCAYACAVVLFWLWLLYYCIVMSAFYVIKRLLVFALGAKGSWIEAGSLEPVKYVGLNHLVEAS